MIRSLLLTTLAVLLGSTLSAQEKKEAIHVDRSSHEIEGWTVLVDKRLEAGEGKEVGDLTFALARADLHRITRLVKPEVLAKLRKVKIVFDQDHGELRPGQYHPSKEWLVANGYKAELAKCVHIPVAKGYADKNHLFTQPAVLLHELAHAYHDQVLGFDNPAIIDAYKAAKEGGRYESVLFIRGRPKRKHYALTNHKEYFAEGTEAFLYVNDFYPFVRGELLEHDSRLAGVLKKIWLEGKTEDL